MDFKTSTHKAPLQVFPILIPESLIKDDAGFGVDKWIAKAVSRAFS